MNDKTKLEFMRINASLHAKRYGSGLDLNQCLLLDNAIKNLESILKSDGVTDGEIREYNFKKNH